MPVSLDERTLNELRHDVSEAHAVASRTHTDLKTLATSLKDVVARQDKYERGLNLNSFVAYLIFTVLLGGAFYSLYRARVNLLVADRDEAMRVRAEALETAAAAKKDADARDAGEKKVAELWGLVADGKRAELLARMPELAAVRASAVEKQVLEEAAARARVELVDQLYAAGLEAVRGQQWKKAVTELRKALSYAGDADGPKAAAMRYHLGVALLKQGEYGEAQQLLDAALAAGIEKNGGPEVRYHLADTLMMTKQPERARAEYLKFSDGHWNHPWAPSARRKAAEIARAARAASAPQ
jgi:TolA-binding protein